jgi:hypothetical protein
VGDQFSYSGYETRDPKESIDSTEIKTTRTILDKQVSGNNDTLTYKCAVCQRRVQYLANGDSLVTPVKDTVDLIYTKESFPYPGWIDRNPEEFYPYLKAGKTIADRYFMSDTSEYNGRQLRGAESNIYTRNAQKCWVGQTDTSSYRILYAAGLGKVLRNSISSLSSHRYQEELVWYSQQGETWGTIPNVDCTPSFGIKDHSRSAEIVVKIVPSPVKSNATVIIETSINFHVSDFYLYDLLGKEVFRLKLTRKEMPFSRQNIPPGVYTWKVKTDNSVLTGKVVFE